MTIVPRINARAALIEFAKQHSLRADWHEPDEQSITATIDGESFDNAGFWPLASEPNLDRRAVEMHVTLRRSSIEDGQEIKGAPLAYVNLATLFAWATGYECPRSTGDKVTMSEARAVIKQEIYHIADELINEFKGNSSVGLAMAAIIKDVADRIGKES